MSGARMTLLVAGLGLALVGAVELLDDGLADLVGLAVWLAGGVVLHDFVLAPVVIALVALGIVLVPAWARAPAAAALVVLGSVTLMAVPVLGRFGARPDNPTLLDRPYLAGWFVFAGLVLLCATGWAWAQRRRGGGA